MKKWSVLLLLLLVLAACSAENAAHNKQEGKADGEKTEEKTEGISEDPSSDKSMQNKKTETQESSTAVGKGEETEKQIPEPKYQITESWSFKPIHNANPKVALLTIDDAPDEHAVEMAKTLRELDAPAIFFVNGHFIDTKEEKEKLRKIHDMGFYIGNHTDTHASLPELTKEEQKEEIIGLNNKIEEIIGERPKFFRAPHGQNTDYSSQLVEEEKMLRMNWTYGYDWNKEYTDASKLADIMVNTNLLNDGANLLMHDRTWTAEALDDIVKGLRSKGYELLDPAAIRTP